MSDETQTTETAKADPAPAGDDTAHLRREVERLTKALASRQAAEVEARAAAEQAERDAAAKRGEWERLYGEEQARGRTLAEKLAAETGARERYEAHLRERIESAVAGAPEAARATWKAALEGLDPLKAHHVLAALQSAAPTASAPTPKPGAAGPTRSVLRFDPHSDADRQAAVLAALKRAAAGGE